MHWLAIIVMAVVLGWLSSLFLRRFGLGPIVCIPIAIIGAVLGGTLDRVSMADVYGMGSFYGIAFLGCLLSIIGASAWCYAIVGSEKRI